MDLQLDKKIELEVARERVIKEEGKQELLNYLAQHLTDTRPEYIYASGLGIADWVLRQTEYTWSTPRGNFPKRLGKVLHNLTKEYNYFKSTVDIGMAGSIASRYAPARQKYLFDITNSLTWNAGDFGDSGSCYWRSNEGARDVLMDNGGMALRFFDPKSEKGLARTWLIPHDNRLVQFNAYGPYLLHEQADVLSKFLGVTHKQITLENWGQTGGLLYINGKARIVGTNLDYYSSLDLELGDEPVPQCECNRCGRTVDEDDAQYINDEAYCERCADLATYCDRCETSSFEDGNAEVSTGWGTQIWCRYCLDNASWCEEHDLYYDGTCPEQPECETHGTYDCDESACPSCAEESDANENA